MKQLVAVLTVLLAIVVIWYAACIPMNIKGVLTDFFATKTKAELLDAAIQRKVLITPVWTAADVVASPQLESRDYWEDIEQPGFGTVRHPGAFAKVPARPHEVLPAAPSLGADTDAVVDQPARSPAVAISASQSRSPEKLTRRLPFAPRSRPRRSGRRSPTPTASSMLTSPATS